MPDNPRGARRSESAKPTVFVLDDDPSIRRALRRLIESVDLDVELFAGADEFLRSYDPSRSGCLLVDVRMPGISGLDLQEILAERGIELPLVFITGHGDVPMAARALKAGAVDFIEKPFNEQLLLDALSDAVDRDRTQRRDAAEQRKILDRVALLTPRELEVMKLVVAGRMNKEVAHSLSLTEATIKVHRGRVMSKMKARSLPDLVVMAQIAGLRSTKV